MPSANMLGVVLHNVVMLIITFLNDMLNVVMLSTIMVSVEAPTKDIFFSQNRFRKVAAFLVKQNRTKQVRS
jgi:hypothetical protein